MHTDQQIQRQRRLMREEAWALTPAERMRRFARLQAEVMERLHRNPDAWRHFLERNYRKRRTVCRHGTWVPAEDI